VGVFIGDDFFVIVINIGPQLEVVHFIHQILKRAFLNEIKTMIFARVCLASVYHEDAVDGIQSYGPQSRTYPANGSSQLQSQQSYQERKKIELFCNTP
jgi:hypothetical protein